MFEVIKLGFEAVLLGVLTMFLAAAAGPQVQLGFFIACIGAVVIIVTSLSGIFSMVL